MKILIRSSPARRNGLCWWDAPGWTWHCPCCGTGGRASWGSRLRVPRDPKAKTPYQRVIASVDRHLRERHTIAHAWHLLGRYPAPAVRKAAGGPE